MIARLIAALCKLLLIGVMGFFIVGAANELRYARRRNRLAVALWSLFIAVAAAIIVITLM